MQGIMVDWMCVKANMEREEGGRNLCVIGS